MDVEAVGYKYNCRASFHFVKEEAKSAKDLQSAIEKFLTKAKNVRMLVVLITWDTDCKTTNLFCAW